MDKLEFENGSIIEPIGNVEKNIRSERGNKQLKSVWNITKSNFEIDEQKIQRRKGKCIEEYCDLDELYCCNLDKNNNLEIRKE